MTVALTAVAWTIQSTVLALAGLVASRLLVRAPAGVRLRWHQVVLAMSLVVPWLVPSGPGMSSIVPSADVVVASVTSAQLMDTADAAEEGWPSMATILVAVWLVGMSARLLWLGIGLVRLRSLRRSSRALHDPLLDSARLRTCAEAACRVSARVAQPMTWGLGTPTVLVPRRLRRLPARQREAIYVHELLHVARGDTRVVVLEELLRAALWFHPAVWLVVARLRLVREEVVDQATVALTSARRPYLEALLWCAEETRSRQRPLAAVVPFFTRHQLLTRVASLTREGTMSSTRLALALATAGVIVSVGALTASSLAPLPAVSGGPGAQVPDPMEPGPLERAAVLPTLDAPAPRRTLAVEPEWPADAQALGLASGFRMHVVVTSSGAVGEARIDAPTAGGANLPVDADGSAVSRAHASLRQAALAAVRQWQFEPPSVAPILIVTDVEVGDVPAMREANRLRHVRTSGGGLALRAPGERNEDDSVVRVGGDVRAPRKIVDVPPVYPEEALAAKVQGVVIVEAVLEATGDVSDVRLVRSIPLLDQAAIDAVRQWKYEATGQRLMMTMTVNFTLTE